MCYLLYIVCPVHSYRAIFEREFQHGAKVDVQTSFIYEAVDCVVLLFQIGGVISIICVFGHLFGLCSGCIGFVCCVLIVCDLDKNKGALVPLYSSPNFLDLHNRATVITTTWRLGRLTSGASQVRSIKEPWETCCCKTSLIEGSIRRKLATPPRFFFLALFFRSFIVSWIHFLLSFFEALRHSYVLQIVLTMLSTLKPVSIIESRRARHLVPRPPSCFLLFFICCGVEEYN